MYKTGVSGIQAQEYQKKRYLTKSKYREYQKKYAKNKNYELRKLVLAKLGNECVKCGFDDWRALQIDHVNGGGSKERKEKRSGSSSMKYYSLVLNDTNNKYQLLCANCNWIKRYENNENAKERIFN